MKPVLAAPSLEESEYKVNAYGEIVHKVSEKKFTFGPTAEYLKLQSLISKHLRTEMLKKYDLIEIPPIPVTEVKLEPGTEFEPALISKKYKEAKKLLIILKGAGSFGYAWSIVGCVLDDINQGSMLPYLETAQQQGYSVVIAHPNLQCYANEDRNIVYRKHFQYLWENFISKSEASQMDIVAASYGGVVVCNAITDIGPAFRDRINKVSFLDSVHRISVHFPNASVEDLKWMEESCIQYKIARIAKGHALGFHKELGCQIISSGTDSHDCVPFFCELETFLFFSESKSNVHTPFLLVGAFFIVAIGVYYFSNRGKEDVEKL